MARYMVQFSYSAGAVSALVKNPQDRSSVARDVVERLGGKLEAFYFCFGDFDGLAIAELPDNASAAAVSMALSGSGESSSVKTTVLLTAEEAVEGMRKAGTLGYPSHRE
jgi:uncharacterized protein with GYD domain